MKKFFLIALTSISIVACNNNTTVNTEQAEQHLRDSMDAAQHIKDSLDVDAKMKAEMAADTSSSEASTTTEPAK